VGPITLSHGPVVGGQCPRVLSAWSPYPLEVGLSPGDPSGVVYVTIGLSKTPIAVHAFCHALPHRWHQ